METVEIKDKGKRCHVRGGEERRGRIRGVELRGMRGGGGAPGGVGKLKKRNTSEGYNMSFVGFV